MKPTLGIDVALRTFWAALRFDQQHIAKKEFANDRTGLSHLRSWLHQHFAGQVKAALESTNNYGDALLQWLYDEGHEVFLLNPEHVVLYGRSIGQRNKTDCVDCVTIAAYIALHDATPWRPPTAEQKALRSLTRARHQLVATASALACQCRTADQTARPHLDAVLRKIREQLKQIARDIATHLKQHTQLGALVCRLMTMKGVGLVTAATLVAELPPITAATDPRTIAAWAGLTPRRRQSGAIELPTRISRKGNVYVRDALYMPALVAKRYNPILRKFAERLKSNGKSNNAILGAVAHKMLRILVGLLRTNTDFDPQWSFQKR